MTRRQLLPLLATVPCYHGCRNEQEEKIWNGVLFNNPVSVRYRSATNLNQTITKRVQELDATFSLYEAGSELQRLNSVGSLESPSADFLQLLLLCQSFHEQSGGAFDPTIQSYWVWLNQEKQAGRQPTERERKQARELVGFSRVQVEPEMVRLNQTQLTLNGVAQGFASDQVYQLLRNQGVRKALVNLGEYRALGGPFDIEIRHPDSPKRVLKKVPLTDQALAVSSGSGHRMSATGEDNHILSPQSGQSPPALRTAIALAPDAVTADAWATILSLQPELANTLPDGVEALVL